MVQTDPNEEGHPLAVLSVRRTKLRVKVHVQTLLWQSVVSVL